MTENLSRANGMVYGLAIGDALGRVTEFMSLHDLKSAYGENGITNLPEPAFYTDDTQMSVAIAEALIRAGEKDLEAIMQAVKEDFVKWYHSPENTRAPGRTVLTAMSRLLENRSLAGSENEVMGLEEYNRLVGLTEIRNAEKKYGVYGEETSGTFSAEQ